MKTNLKVVHKDDPIPAPALCRQIVEEYKSRVKPSGPTVNQHAEIVAPRMDVDKVLKETIRLTDKELKG